MYQRRGSVAMGKMPRGSKSHKKTPHPHQTPSRRNEQSEKTAAGAVGGETKGAHTIIYKQRIPLADQFNLVWLGNSSKLAH